MSAPAAIRATFADWRTVKGRKQLQLIFEVPLEQQEEVLRYLGAPMPDQAAWCGIARLNVGPQMSGSAAGLESGGTAGPEPEAVTAGGPAPLKERRPFHTLPRSQQAALACQDETFQRWAGAESEDPDGDAAEFVRFQCRVHSRAVFDTDPAAGRRWDILYADYQIASGRMAEPR